MAKMLNEETYQSTKGKILQVQIETGKRPDIIAKKVDNNIKLWKKCNDEMYYTRKTLNLDKDQFEIIEVQIVGDTLYLNALIRNKINTLLLLRNILITNISLLCHGSISKSQRQMKKNITVSTPMRDEDN
ncbi:hypothetical protein Glove_86g107 [Diversispora epigaea]|uniref:Uncharacterized protein n=1 Tax=Diversispora epigaea TaxID=1348612 RepID=A0A397J6P4_9GLOM|nr:hypothetical protein Glove_86g107 [Diversispora epigaea]